MDVSNGPGSIQPQIYLFATHCWVQHVNQSVMAYDSEIYIWLAAIVTLPTFINIWLTKHWCPSNIHIPHNHKRHISQIPITFTPTGLHRATQESFLGQGHLPHGLHVSHVENLFWFDKKLYIYMYAHAQYMICIHCRRPPLCPNIVHICLKGLGHFLIPNTSSWANLKAV